MALDKDKIIEDLKGASILELNDLVKAIEDEFDVSAAAPVAAAGAGDAAAAKSTFDVELTEAGQEKVKVIKLYVTSLVLALRTQRTLLTALLRTLRKAFQKTKLTTSSLSLKKLAQL